MITYKRHVPAGQLHALDETERHVRAHLSAIADTDDDPNTYAADVRIHHRQTRDGVEVVGSLDADPVAAYLDPDFAPYEGVPDELRAEAR